MAKASTKPKKKISKAEQSRRFIETARELGVDENSDVLERIVDEIAKPVARPKKKSE